MGCLWAVIYRVVLFLVIVGGAFYMWKLFTDSRGDVYKKDQTAYESTENRKSSKMPQTYYFYEQLSSERKQIYDEIYKGLKNHDSKIVIGETDTHIVDNVYQRVLMDHPEIFWNDGSYQSTTYRGLGSRMEISPGYLMTKSESETYQDEIEQVADEWLSGISDQASDYEKILYVYEKIIREVDYDTNAEHNQNIYSVFAKRRSVCAGYAKATQYLLQKLGVFCTYVTGTAKTTGGRHAWNLVWCDGSYYYVDTTWGDPVFVGESGKNSDQIIYDFMCCSTEELTKTHTIDARWEMPECNSMEDNYYVRNGDYYTSYNQNEIWNKMKQDIDEEQPETVIKFADPDLYARYHLEIVDELAKKGARRIAQRYGIFNVSYQYQDDEQTSKIIIHWNYRG